MAIPFIRGSIRQDETHGGSSVYFDSPTLRCVASYSIIAKFISGPSKLVQLWVSLFMNINLYANQFEWEMKEKSPILGCRALMCLVGGSAVVDSLIPWRFERASANR